MDPKPRDPIPVLLAFIEAPGNLQRLADSVANGSTAYVQQLARGHRRPSFKLAQRIESATRGEVPKESLRPDVWGAAPVTPRRKAG